MLAAKIINNPFDTILSIFNKRHPGKQVEVMFVDELYNHTFEYGVTIFPEDENGLFEIEIDISTPIAKAVDVLAHELAHVAMGEDSFHGDNWYTEFSAINDEFNGIMMGVKIKY